MYIAYWHERTYFEKGGKTMDVRLPHGVPSVKNRHGKEKSLEQLVQECTGSFKVNHQKTSWDMHIPGARFCYSNTVEGVEWPWIDVEIKKDARGHFRRCVEGVLTSDMAFEEKINIVAWLFSKFLKEPINIRAT